ILSNTNVLHFEYVSKKFPIVREIGCHILSYEVRVRKPDPKIYQIAMERFRVLPQQTLYIDDREDFVIASRQLGLYGVHFCGEDKLISEIRSLGLLGS
ncbi:MAG: HAD-IA family hydrolase, partial [Candidatus Omnitrophota bacterium]